MFDLDVGRVVTAKNKCKIVVQWQWGVLEMTHSLVKCRHLDQPDILDEQACLTECMLPFLSPCYFDKNLGYEICQLSHWPNTLDLLLCFVLDQIQWSIFFFSVNKILLSSQGSCKEIKSKLGNILQCMAKYFPSFKFVLIRC